MKLFTVISVCEDTGQVSLAQTQADGPHEAMREIAATFSSPEDWTIIGAIPGKHDLTPPCEDSGKVACGTDIAPCECGRTMSNCTTFEDNDATHGDR